MSRTSVKDSSAGADTPTLRSSHAQPPGRTKLMDKVTQPPTGGHRPVRRSRRVQPAASPRLIEEAVRVFLALGITEADLRLRATPGSVLIELADAMGSPAGGP